MESRKMEATFQHGFKRIKPKAVTLERSELVNTSFLSEDETLPLLVQPEAENLDLVEWASHNRDFIETKLIKHGALLFRNFKINMATDFEQFALSICPALLKDNGEHPRKNISGNVYTPIFYPPEKKVSWHNENSFNYRWPTKIWFGCVLPASSGGETTMADSRKVYELMPPRIRDRFMEKGVMYVRNYGLGLGLDWQTVFNTDDKSEVERICNESFMQYQWKEDDTLLTRSVRPAVVKHPKTGEMVWFTQAQHWHSACLDAATRKSLISLFREEDFPRNCYYGDGSRIEDSVMLEILDVYRGLEISFPWQQRDILMIDNLLTAHARNPFAGGRKILVAMGEMLSYAEV